jgi:hypothetical protein
MRLQEADFLPPGVRTEGAPCLGKVTTSHGRIIQRIEPSMILSEEARTMLFAEAC